MTKARLGHATGGLKKGVFYNGKQLRTDFEADGKGLEWRSDHRRGSEDADPHRRYHALRDKAATFTPSACFLRDRARVKETLIKSQSRISHGFLYIASSSSSLNSLLFASDDSSLCIRIQE